MSVERMSFSHVHIACPAVEKLKVLVRSIGKLEIGGPMVGFVSGKVLVVTDLDGPGEMGICSAFSVTIDGEHSKRFCDTAFERSNGLIDYVGDWHCHPSVCIWPSSGDERAMEIIAGAPGLTPNPVSLIYGTVLGRFKIYRWNGSEGTLIRIPHEVIGATLIERLINKI